MKVEIPCIECKRFNDCGARKICIKEFLAGQLTCYDCDPLPQYVENVSHRMPLGAHLFKRDDGRYLLPDKDSELKSLNEAYQTAVRSSILQLLRICERLLSDT